MSGRTRNTDGTPSTTGVAVTTWADGWGAYGATVTGARDTAAAKRRAAAAIRARFADSDRWGRGWRLELMVVGVEVATGERPAMHRFRER